MKFITVRDLRTTPAQVWKSLPEEKELVITNNGRPIALLTPISGETMEETLREIRRARAITAVQKIQARSVSVGHNQMSNEEIEDEIRRARENSRS